MPPDVRDSAEVFSPAVAARANEQMRDCLSTYGTELVVEYSPQVPEAGWWDKLKKRLLSAKDPANRRSFYSDWAKREVQTHPNRIYVLICKNPEPLQVEIAAGRELRQRGMYSESDAAALRLTLLELFGAGRNDDALDAAVEGVTAALKTNRGKIVPPREPFPWAATLSVAGILAVLWIGVSAAQHRHQVGDTPESGDFRRIVGNFPTSIYTTAAGIWTSQSRPWPTPPEPATLSPPVAFPVDRDPNHQEPSHG
jgi:hypothetical protein